MSHHQGTCCRAAAPLWGGSVLLCTSAVRLSVPELDPGTEHGAPRWGLSGLTLQVFGDLQGDSHEVGGLGTCWGLGRWDSPLRGTMTYWRV